MDKALETSLAEKCNCAKCSFVAAVLLCMVLNLTG